MKYLYFDLIGGISGDMTVAALLDLGVSFGFLKKELSKLGVRGYSLEISTVTRGHGQAKKFDVKILTSRNYSYRQIVALIKRSRLADGAKGRALSMYKALAEAEKKVHGHAHADLHFHQVGDLDSVIDIVATAVCLEALGVEKILYSVVPVNSFLAPASMDLLCGNRVVFTGIRFENVTPTGMAILAALGRQTRGDSFDVCEIGRSGYGGGSMDPVEVSNVLRVTELRPGNDLASDEIFALETNIDDMSPQFFEPVMEKLFGAGALDVFLTNIVMKKSRPAFLLTALSSRENFDRIARIVLSDTTSIGVRFYPVKRLKLLRKAGFVSCYGRRVAVKICELPGRRLRVQPEYDDCKLLADSKNLPFLDVYSQIKKKADIKWPSQA